MNDKMLLAMNTVCPETLARLANDDDYWVRRGVAYNPNTPQYIRTYLKLQRTIE